MAFITDTFTEGGFTDLENHTADSGATYTKHPESANNGGLEVDANNDALRVDNNDNNYSLYYASEVPSSAEYDLEITVERLGTDNGGTRNLGVCGRVDTTSEDYYAAVWDNANDEWELWKIVGGTKTVLDTFAETFSTGTTRDVKLEIRDAAKKVFIDGVERMSSTDNAITAAGRAGFTGQASNTKLLADDFTATDAATGGTTESISATLAGSSSDGVGSTILNLAGTTTLAGTSTTTGAITVEDLVALSATLAGTSADAATPSLAESLAATLAGTSSDSGAVSTEDMVALTATLAGTSLDSGRAGVSEGLTATLAGSSTLSGPVTTGEGGLMIPGTGLGLGIGIRIGI